MTESRLILILAIAMTLMVGVLMFRPPVKIPTGMMDVQPSARFSVTGGGSVEITKFTHETLDEWRVRCAAIVTIHLNRNR